MVLTRFMDEGIIYYIILFIVILVVCNICVFFFNKYTPFLVNKH